MKKMARVSTEYGPVDLELTQCDAPGCTSCKRTEFLLGWHKLEPLGMEAPTMGKLPGPLEFCSLRCLVQAVGPMAGN